LLEGSGTVNGSYKRRGNLGWQRVSWSELVLLILKDPMVDVAKPPELTI